MQSPIYKVLTAEQWQLARAGAPVEAPIDVQDGYVHFSTAATLQGTLDKWFRGQIGCVLLEFEAADFGAELKWEKARDDRLFPHVYGVVSARLARRTWSLEPGEDGVPQAPPGLG